MVKKKDSRHLKDSPPGWQAAAGISKPQRGLGNDSIAVANASVFRRGAKISYLSMLHIVVGFAQGTPITMCSELSETHRDTVRDLYHALRHRLCTPRFDAWVQSAYAAPDRPADEDAAMMEEAKVALFGCHENRDCLKRYNAGRRKTRVCRACPVRGYVRSEFDGDTDTSTGDDGGAPRAAGAGWVGGRQPALEFGEDEFEKATSDLVDLVDRVRRFYYILGWNESDSGDDRRALFDRRFRHYEILSTAIGHSEIDDDGTVHPDDDAFLSVAHLAKTLVHDLMDRPLD